MSLGGRNYCASLSFGIWERAGNGTEKYDNKNYGSMLGVSDGEIAIGGNLGERESNFKI